MIVASVYILMMPHGGTMNCEKGIQKISTCDMNNLFKYSTLRQINSIVFVFTKTNMFFGVPWAFKILVRA